MTLDILMKYLKNSPLLKGSMGLAYSDADRVVSHEEMGRQMKSWQK